MKKANIPLRHRIYLAVAVVEVVLFSGTMLGWSSLLFLLKNEGFFHELCEIDSGENSSLPVPSFGSVSSGACVAQEERYSLVVTSSSGFGNGFSVVVGLAIDKLGAKKVRGMARYNHFTVITQTLKPFCFATQLNIISVTMIKQQSFDRESESELAPFVSLLLINSWTNFYMRIAESIWISLSI